MRDNNLGMETKIPKEIREKLKGVFMAKSTKDVFIFLFFVFICTIFWFVRELEESFSTEISVPVTLTDVPKGIIITTDVPKELRLTIHGKGVELLPYMLGKQTDTLRLSFKTYDSHEQSGHGILLLSQLQSNLRKLLPPSASITTMSPDTVYFFYNRGQHKRLPICLRGSIEAAAQYCITGTHFTPDSADVYAPLAVLDTMQAVYTERVYIKNTDKSSTRKVKMQTARGMRVIPDSTTLKTEVDILSKQSVEVPVVGVNFPANKTLRTFPSSVKISYLVPQNQSKNIDISDFVVVITYAELLENTSTHCRPHISNTPKGVTGALIDPLEVDYLLENIATEDEEESAEKKGEPAKKDSKKKRK